MKTKRKSILVSGIMLFVMISCKEPVEEAVVEQRSNVKTQKVFIDKTYKRFSYSGQLESRERSTLSFLVGGMIKTMHVEEGQQVRKGTLLASLAPEDYSNELLLQEARLLEAEDTYERMKSLYGKNSVPESDFIKAKAAYLSVDAMVKIATKKLSDTKIYAPYDGMIFKKVTRAGTVVSPGASIYELVDLNDLEIVIAVPQNEINILKMGDQIQATLPALSNKQVTGKITSIVAVADVISRSYRVKAAIKNSEGILKDGMLANVEVRTTDMRKTVSIPGNAVLRSASNIPYVFKYNEQENRVLQQRIKVGSALGQNIEILEGLSEQDVIVVEGHHLLKDGTLVNKVNDEKA